jgi:hypothetical protein
VLLVMWSDRLRRLHQTTEGASGWVSHANDLQVISGNHDVRPGQRSRVVGKKFGVRDGLGTRFPASMLMKSSHRDWGTAPAELASDES